MRMMMMVAAAVGLLGPPSLGVINVKLTADGPTWNGNPAVMPGQATTVHLWAQGTNAGVYSLAGDIVASGSGLSKTNPYSLVRTPEFFPAIMGFPYGTPGPNGGWVGFPALQTTWDTPDPNLGRATYVEICSYTITAGTPWTWGPVTLTFVPRSVAGFKPLETDKTGIMGTITPLTLTVIPEPVTLALFALGGLMVARRRHS